MKYVLLNILYMGIFQPAMFSGKNSGRELNEFVFVTNG